MGKAKKTTTDKQPLLEAVLEKCRNALRNVGTTDKKRDAVISLMFLKFASDKFEKQRKKIIESANGDSRLAKKLLDSKDSYEQDNVFIIPDDACWSLIIEKAGDGGIATYLDNALAEVQKANQDNNALQGALSRDVFTSLNAESSKIKDLIDNVNLVSEDKFPGEDLIGRVYEYFLKIYAASGSKEEGEFYTPASVVRLITELIEPYKGTVYDPCCGSGGMFVQSLDFVERHNGKRENVSILGQELQPETWRLCKMNLAIRGIDHDIGLEAASTFTNDQHSDRDHKVDFVMANPPFNLKKWRNKKDLRKDDPRFQGVQDGKKRIIPPASNANYAWILHIIHKLNRERGIAGFLLANGALNAGKNKKEKDKSEYFLRKHIIDKDYVEAIITLPRNMFYGTDIPVTLWIINMNKKGGASNGKQLRDRRSEILFIDLRSWDKKIEEIKIDSDSKKGSKRKKIVLDGTQRARVKEIYNNWQSEDRSLYRDVPELCRSANIDEIRDKDYSLAPSKYIEFIDHDLEIDYTKEMKRIQKEMREVLEQETQAQNMLKQAFKGVGYGID